MNKSLETTVGEILFYYRVDWLVSAYKLQLLQNKGKVRLGAEEFLQTVIDKNYTEKEKDTLTRVFTEMLLLEERVRKACREKDHDE